MTLAEWVAGMSYALLSSSGELAQRCVTSLLAESPLPLALFRFDCAHPMIESAAWRSLFGSVGPSAHELQRAVRSTYVGSTCAEVRLHDQTWRFALRRIVFENDTRGFVAVSSQVGVDVMPGQREAVLDRLFLAIREAETANATKDEVLSSVVHALRAPVSTILLWENVLRDHADDPALRVRALDAIRESANLQSRQVADLLDISRAIGGKLRIERGQVAIDPILAAAVESLAPAANAKSLAIETAIRPRLGRVLADPVRLRQVFDNLLSNAVKFTPSGGTITIDARRDRDSVVVTISDTGRGIDEARLRQLFRPFSRQAEGSNCDARGLHVGLAIAKYLVELHEGTLTATSEGRDRGSSFTLTLPLASRLTTTPPPRASAVRRLDGINVLLVDDDPYAREALELLLKHLGATVAVARSAAEAREKLAAMHADVVVCDISMPVEDGYSFLRALRETSGDVGQIPAIALTAYATPQDRERAAAAGFDGHLTKPVQLRALASEIVQLVAARI